MNAIKFKSSKGLIDVMPQKLYKEITITGVKENEELFKSGDTIKAIINIEPLKTPREKYCQSSHNSKPTQYPKVIWVNNELKRVDGKTFRKEEWICKYAKFENPNKNKIGMIVDYQVPIKVNGLSKEEKQINEGLGKIDLLSHKGKTLWLLEYKVEDNKTEHPLRAILEIYTYWKLLEKNIGEPLMDEYNKEVPKGLPKIEKLDKAIVLYKGSKLHDRLEKCQVSKDLMEKLDVKCFFVEKADSDLDFNVI